jgi:methionine synthase II (cobalamin-independent)
MTVKSMLLSMGSLPALSTEPVPCVAAGSRTGQHDANWQRRMNDAARFAIDMQEQAGIDIVSDGEWRRETMSMSSAKS